MLKNSIFICLALTISFSAFAADFKHDVKTAKKPWNHLNFQNQKKEFSFVILPDRCGGERKKGIWAKAVEQANMFHPDFIMTVGDMIEGINSPKILNKKTLEKQYADDNAEFISIKKSIPSEDMVAVQAERYTIRDEYTKSNIQQLQEKYGRKYSYDIYKDVEADVNMELHEKPFSILMRLEKNKQRNTDHNHTKYRNHEQER